MGMFDYVNHEAPCHECGRIIKGWQSKSGACAMETLTTEDVTNFYGICPDPDCDTWNEYVVEIPSPRKFKLVNKEGRY